MEEVWLRCKEIKDFSFYELKTPREELVLFDRYEFVHPDLGIIFEPVSILSRFYFLKYKNIFFTISNNF
jgi:hypothetical protein